MQLLSKPSIRRIADCDVEDIDHEITVKFSDWGIDLNTVVRIDLKLYHPAFQNPYEVSYYVYYGSF